MFKVEQLDTSACSQINILLKKYIYFYFFLLNDQQKLFGLKIEGFLLILLVFTNDNFYILI